MADEITEELWKVKDSIAREYDYDIDALVTHLSEIAAPYGNLVVDLAARRRAGQEQSADTDDASCR